MLAALLIFLRPKSVTAHTNLRVEVQGCGSSIMAIWSGKHEIWSGKSHGILFPMKSGHPDTPLSEQRAAIEYL